MERRDLYDMTSWRWQRVREVTLSVPKLFDYSWSLDFLAERAVPFLEEVWHGNYCRTIRLGNDEASILVRLKDSVEGTQALLIRLATRAPADQIANAVARMFDLAAPVEDFLEHVRTDPDLGPLTRHRPGIRLPVFPDPCEGVVRAILGQQVSIAAARTVTSRLVCLFAEKGPKLDGRELYLFPRPSSLATLPLRELCHLGLTRAKALAVKTVSRALADGSLDFTELAACDVNRAAKTLQSLPGIGPWTTAYVMMRVMGNRDAFPATDLGVAKVVSRRHGKGRFMTTSEVESLAKAWQPWRAYATLHLWNCLMEANA